MNTLQLAWRNVLRQRRRSALTVLAIVLSLAMFLVLRGVGDGAHQQIAEIGVRMGLGDVVIQARGYREDPSLDHLVKGRCAPPPPGWAMRSRAWRCACAPTG
jgi:hypothetical protein